jgi:hypothetical protein
MPRGRKKSPQDSIDSILLAMSRRSDIDSGTLSHYFDRLDEEWTEGARDKVLHLLRTNDTSAHSAAVLILTELATGFDLRELEKFVADPTVSDMAKLSLAPILKELGSDITDDRIIEYLKDPEAAMLQMQARLLDLVGQSELGAESVLEDVTLMPVERRLGFVNWLGHSRDARAAYLLVPLMEHQPAKVATAAIDALEQLGTAAAHQTIPALNYLIANSTNRQLKQQARAALGRLTMQSAPGVEDAAMIRAQQQLPLYQARVSFVDGTGSQMIMISWQRPDGLLKGVNVLYQDQWGIKDCYGTDGMEIERWSELVSDVEEQGFINFQVSLEYCRALIADARALNKRTRRKLPIAYSIWRPYLAEDITSREDTTALPTMLAARPFNPDLANVARHGDQIYQMSEFESWLFEPLVDILPYINRYWLIYNVFDMLSTGTSQSGRGRRKGQKSQKPQRPNLDALVSEALEALIDEDWRTLYEARLRRQGALFQFAGRDDDAALVSAVASALHPDSGLSVHEQPFLQTMMRLSIEGGPMRMMAEVIEDANFGLGPIPIDPFSQP